VRRASYSLLWATVLASVVLAPAGGALAAGGTTTSAGDQQYLDPLASSTPSAPPPTAPPATPPITSPASAPSTGAAHHDPGGRTLPYTGFNVWVLVWAGLGLITLGLALRRMTRRRQTPDGP
jgi:LPXTG-motif cell wall-anchored protein